jgi:hypothetical protein
VFAFDREAVQVSRFESFHRGRPSESTLITVFPEQVATEAALTDPHPEDCSTMPSIEHLRQGLLYWRHLRIPWGLCYRHPEPLVVQLADTVLTLGLQAQLTQLLSLQLTRQVDPSGLMAGAKRRHCLDLDYGIVELVSARTTPEAQPSSWRDLSFALRQSGQRYTSFLRPPLDLLDHRGTEE